MAQRHTVQCERFKQIKKSLAFNKVCVKKTFFPLSGWWKVEVFTIYPKLWILEKTKYKRSKLCVFQTRSCILLSYCWYYRSIPVSYHKIGLIYQCRRCLKKIKYRRMCEDAFIVNHIVTLRLYGLGEISLSMPYLQTWYVFQCK